MSKNISNLSGRIGLKDNLFKKMSENVLNDSPKDIKEIAKEYNLGVSTIHGAESFYEFLRPSHREKKWTGTQKPKTFHASQINFLKSSHPIISTERETVRERERKREW